MCLPVVSAPTAAWANVVGPEIPAAFLFDMDPMPWRQEASGHLVEISRRIVANQIGRNTWGAKSVAKKAVQKEDGRLLAKDTWQMPNKHREVLWKYTAIR